MPELMCRQPFRDTSPAADMFQDSLYPFTTQWIAISVQEQAIFLYWLWSDLLEITFDALCCLRAEIGELFQDTFILPLVNSTSPPFSEASSANLTPESSRSSTITLSRDTSDTAFKTAFNSSSEYDLGMIFGFLGV